MKKFLFALIVIIAFNSCKTETKEETTTIVNTETVKTLKPITATDMETAVIYEANIRQYSPEGTFEAFTKDIPKLKELGVKIIWLMPVFPISETKRKATGGADSKFASDFPEDEQAKYLGSYYAVTNYTEINPEFGTKANFRKLIQTAHANGIYVILDWVPNHTGWDHEWLKTNPEYYTQDAEGKVVHPENTDWTDVADLNYNNKDMRKAMIADMSYWITEEDIDGFRCDVAGSVPLDFWQDAVPKLRGEKDIFMLAEAWEPELLDGDLFDMAYAWEGHHLMNALAKGEKTLKDYVAYTEKVNTDYDPDDILMNFVTNHDENSWNGTIKERMGKSSELMTVLSYMLKGMPLIYSGQEYDLNHRLKFFEKDSFPKTKGKTWDLLQKLGHLKTTNAALHGGKNAASYKLGNFGKDVLMFERYKDNDTLIFIGNFCDESRTIGLPKKDYINALTNKKADVDAINAWDYKILSY